MSFLGLGRVFTANMTGNLVLLGIAIGQGQLEGSVRSVVAFAGFALAVLIGVRLTEEVPSPSSKSPSLWPRSVTIALLAEFGLLVAFLAGWEVAGVPAATPVLAALVALSAGAMGVQAGAARRLGVAGVTTVFVTGMLTSLIAEVATAGPGRQWVLWTASLVALVIGAAAGAALFMTWRPGAPLVAVVLVGIVIAAATWTTRRSGSRGS